MRASWDETDFLNYKHSYFHRSGKCLWKIRCYLESVNELICMGLENNIFPSPTGVKVSAEAAEIAMSRIEKELTYERDCRQEKEKETSGFDKLPPLAKIAVAQRIQELLNEK